MNPNLAEVGKPTRWPPGKSGRLENRQALGLPFLKALFAISLVWAEEGLEAVRKVAKKGPEAFV
jgi:hypothetical protein